MRTPGRRRRHVSVVPRADQQRPEPEPLEVDLRLVLLVGIVAWFIALVAVLVLTLTDAIGSGDAIAIISAGLALGAIGLLWERRNRRRYRAADTSPVADEAAGSQDSPEHPA